MSISEKLSYLWIERRLILSDYDHFIEMIRSNVLNTSGLAENSSLNTSQGRSLMIIVVIVILSLFCKHELGCKQ